MDAETERELGVGRVTVIRDPDLVAWLREQGADEGAAYCFYLEKGLGERMFVTILGKTDVEIAWCGRPAEQG